MNMELNTLQTLLEAGGPISGCVELLASLGCFGGCFGVLWDALHLIAENGLHQRWPIMVYIEVAEK